MASRIDEKKIEFLILFSFWFFLLSQWARSRELYRTVGEVENAGSAIF